MEYVKYDSKQREALKKNLRRLMDEKGVTKTQLARSWAGPITQSIIGYAGIAYPIGQESRLYAIISEFQTWNY